MGPNKTPPHQRDGGLKTSTDKNFAVLNHILLNHVLLNH